MKYLIFCILSTIAAAQTGSGFSAPSQCGNWYILNRGGDFSNSETQCYNAAHVSCAPNALTITFNTSAQSCGDWDHTTVSHANQSGMVQLATRNFTFGDFQAKIEFTSGWPAFWMEGSENGGTHGCQAVNPYSADNVTVGGVTADWNSDANHCPEVDIAEVKTGVSNNTTVFQNNCSATNDADADYGTCNALTASATTTNVTTNFHVYELKWVTGSLTWFIDGVQTNTTTNRVPQSAMFMMFNVAASPTNGTPTNGQQMTVQWVKHCPSSCANATSPIDANADFVDTFNTIVPPAPSTGLFAEMQ